MVERDGMRHAQIVTEQANGHARDTQNNMRPSMYIPVMIVAGNGRLVDLLNIKARLGTI